MARVELTQNKGPEVINSFNDAVDSSGVYGPIVNVRNYTLHSYQVLNTGSQSADFKIIGSNFTDVNGEPSSDFTNHWTTISTHTGIAAGNSLAYSDIWNFKYASVHLTSASGTTISIYEKHNA